MGVQTRPNGRTGRRAAAFVVAVVALVVVTVGRTAVAAPVLPISPGLPTAGGSAQPVAVQRAATAKVADLIGKGSINDTGTRWGVEGTDLGHMFMVGSKMAMTFGDTFGAPAAQDFYSVAHGDWRSNVIASIDPPLTPALGLRFRGMITDRPGHAKELIASKKVKGVQETVIPTYGIATGANNATMNLQYMSVQSFDQPGHWRLTGSGIATSTDGGVTWKDQPAARWPANSKFGQVAYVRPGGPDDPKAPVPAGSTPGDTVYVYGIPGGRYGDLSLAKVPAAQLTEAAAYRYWNGSTWVAGEANATPVIKGPVGELSVRWSSYYKQWIMMYLVDDTGEIVLRTAPAPTGPWSAAQVVTTTKEFPKAYAPYLTPRWNDGPDLWFTMSQFTTYRVELMRTRLQVLPAGASVPAADQPQSLSARSPSLSAPPLPQAAASPTTTTAPTAPATTTTAPGSTTAAQVAPAAATPSTVSTVSSPAPPATPTTAAAGSGSSPPAAASG
ncbi:DUF4185 domain-containing protein [Actinomycetospora sp. TBRC 11914]|uniref:DUF4185 domain-containing protein n=1 Tax=Actinomycetospora sp. TBRC 11914 TaxID=2729387 RepID=UPI00145F2C90|nr:DUF4185 domain-containing protein [Actinomycetospora sp. TBRC 11914]NMO91110.1 DUF4185 domain-containing protein [Actinomycetospora sp. TBRC 11914]